MNNLKICENIEENLCKSISRDVLHKWMRSVFEAEESAKWFPLDKQKHPLALASERSEL